MPLTRRLIGLVALAGVVALLLAPLPPTWLGPWQGKLLDFGHVPLFALLVVILRVTFRSRLVWPLLVAVVVAALAELVQPYFARTRDWGDFVGGVLGALAGATAVRAWQHRRSPRRLTVYSALTLALPVWPAMHVAPYLRDTIAGRRAFPVLIDFSTDEQLRRWEVQQASVARDGRIELRPGDNVFSWAAFRPVNGDFRGYGWLSLDLAVVGEPVELVTSVRTATADKRRTNHAQVGHRLPPGDHVVRLDLGAMAARDPVDYADVRWIQFFVVKLNEPRFAVIRKVWLER